MKDIDGNIMVQRGRGRVAKFFLACRNTVRVIACWYGLGGMAKSTVSALVKNMSRGSRIQRL